MRMGYDAHLEVGATIDRNVWYGVARAIGRICSADFQSASVAMRVKHDAHLEVGATKMDTAY